MNILALDSSGLAASVALVNKDKVLGEFFLNHKKTHSQTLMPLLEGLLKELDFDKKDIDCVAVTKGPGSFTGLRIGMGTAKGLATALGKKMVTVSTLDVIAYNLAEFRGIIVPVMDARRNQVYFSVYHSDGKSIERLWDYDAKDIKEVLDIVSNITDDAVFLGDGAEVFREEIENAGFSIANPTRIIQRAACLGRLALKEAEAGHFVEPGEAELMYLRKSQAERELEERKNNVIYRPIQEGDIDSMVEIEKKCFKIPWSKKMIEDDYKNGLTYYIMCEKAGKVVGYIGMWHVINEGHITNIAITPEEQGKGLANGLMKEMIRLAKEKEMIGVTLEARVSNTRALKLYEKYGFKSEGLRPDYYADNHESAVIMWKRLK